MPQDFRVECGFLRNLKIRKLIAELGLEALEALLALWDYTAQNTPKGVYYGCSLNDFELVAGWRGTPGMLAEYWLRHHFLDKGDGYFAVHEWPKHQPWVYGWPERSAHSKQLALIRWEKKRKAQLDNARTATLEKTRRTEPAGSTSGQVNSNEVSELLARARRRADKQGKGKRK